MFRHTSGIFITVLGFLMMLAPATSAQIAPMAAVTPGTITVLGEGSASVPADTANVVISVGGDSNIYVDPMTIEPDNAATPQAVDATAVVDAIVAFGIPAENVEIVEAPFSGEWGSGMPANPVNILVTVPAPTVDGLSDLLEAVRSAAHDEGLFVHQFGVMYSVEDCRVLRQQARADAFEHARGEAEDQAAAMNMTLGEAVASRDTMSMNTGYYQANSCNVSPTATPYPMIYQAGGFDPGLPAEVTVFVAVEVSFDLP